MLEVSGDYRLDSGCSFARTTGAPPPKRISPSTRWKNMGSPLGSYCTSACSHQLPWGDEASVRMRRAVVVRASEVWRKDRPAVRQVWLWISNPNNGLQVPAGAPAHLLVHHLLGRAPARDACDVREDAAGWVVVLWCSGQGACKHSQTDTARILHVADRQPLCTSRPGHASELVHTTLYLVADLLIQMCLSCHCKPQAEGVLQGVETSASGDAVHWRCGPGH